MLKVSMCAADSFRAVAICEVSQSASLPEPLRSGEPITVSAAAQAVRTDEIARPLRLIDGDVLEIIVPRPRPRVRTVLV